MVLISSLDCSSWDGDRVMDRARNVFTEVMHTPHLYEQMFNGDLTPLFAVESGSRTWGFASEDSDWDVRFVYKRPADHYLRLNDGSDTVHAGGIWEGNPIDAVGWDVKKFLTLVKKGNAQAFEWLNTAIFYGADFNWLEVARPIIAEYLNSAQMAYHYRGMATKHWKRYMQGKDLVVHKKYLYLLRALWLMEWYLENDKMAIRDFSALMWASNAPTAVQVEADTILKLKQFGVELGAAPPHPVLHAYIEERVEHYAGGLGIPVSGAPSWDELNWLFLYTLEMD